MTQQRVALFPGSFDPFTNGHLNTVVRASSMFDRIIIGVMTNTSKHPLFSSQEKIALISQTVADLPNVSVQAGDGQLTVQFAKELGANFLLRGIRNVKDFEYEADIAQMNHQQAAQIETVFLLAAHEYSFLSSSMIKEVAKFGGDISELVPTSIQSALMKKLSQGGKQV